MNVLKVSAKSDPNAVAGAIIGVLKDEREVEIKAIGAGAINQSIKAFGLCASVFKCHYRR